MKGAIDFAPILQSRNVQAQEYLDAIADIGVANPAANYIAKSKQDTELMTGYQTKFEMAQEDVYKAAQEKDVAKVKQGTAMLKNMAADAANPLTQVGRAYKAYSDRETNNALIEQEAGYTDWNKKYATHLSDDAYLKNQAANPNDRSKYAYDKAERPQHVDVGKRLMDLGSSMSINGSQSQMKSLGLGTGLMESVRKVYRDNAEIFGVALAGTYTDQEVSSWLDFQANTAVHQYQQTGELGDDANKALDVMFASGLADEHGTERKDFDQIRSIYGLKANTRAELMQNPEELAKVIGRGYRINHADNVANAMDKKDITRQTQTNAQDAAYGNQQGIYAAEEARRKELAAASQFSHVHLGAKTKIDEYNLVKNDVLNSVKSLKKNGFALDDTDGTPLNPRLKGLEKLWDLTGGNITFGELPGVLQAKGNNSKGDGKGMMRNTVPEITLNYAVGEVRNQTQKAYLQKVKAWSDNTQLDGKKISELDAETAIRLYEESLPNLNIETTYEKLSGDALLQEQSNYFGKIEYSTTGEPIIDKSVIGAMQYMKVMYKGTVMPFLQYIKEEQGGDVAGFIKEFSLAGINGNLEIPDKSGKLQHHKTSLFLDKADEGNEVVFLEELTGMDEQLNKLDNAKAAMHRSSKGGVTSANLDVLGTDGNYHELEQVTITEIKKDDKGQPYTLQTINYYNKNSKGERGSLNSVETNRPDKFPQYKPINTMITNAQKGITNQFNNPYSLNNKTIFGDRVIEGTDVRWNKDYSEPGNDNFVESN